MACPFAGYDNRQSWRALKLCVGHRKHSVLLPSYSGFDLLNQSSPLKQHAGKQVGLSFHGDMRANGLRVWVRGCRCTWQAFKVLLLQT